MLYLDNRESVEKADSFLYYRNKADFGYKYPRVSNNEIIFTQNKELQKLNRDKNVKILSEFLGLKEEMGLYELFSFFFDGKVRNDFDMIEALFNGMLVDSDWCFCLKIGVTFCWFTIGDRGINKLGTMQFSEQVSKYTVGKFIKRLRYNIVKSGINLSKLKFLVWSKEDLSYEFSNYILKFDCLNTFFSSIEGLRGLSIENIMHFLSKDVSIRYQVTAEVFIDCLNDSFTALKISQKDGVLYSRNTYYKDYSTCISPIVNKSECSYGIILDCEGQLGGDGSIDAGCREIGGIIYCKYHNILTSIDTFSCDNLLLEDTLLQVIRNYKEFSGSFVKSINVICYGASDQKMLLSSVNELCSHRSIKLISSLFNFVDCRTFVQCYLYANEINVDGKQTLSNIAKALGVKPLFPKHKPLNDVRTLFNILAQILMITDDFCIIG